jgi:hypothetical protein
LASTSSRNLLRPEELPPLSLWLIACSRSAATSRKSVSASFSSRTRAFPDTSFFLCGVSHPGSLGPGGYVQGGEDRAAGGFQLAAAGVSAVVAVADVAARARAAQGICPHRGAAEVAASGVGSCSPGFAVGRGGLVGCAATGRGIERAVQAGRMPCAGGSARARAPQTHPPAGGRRSHPSVLECARTRALG